MYFHELVATNSRELSSVTQEVPLHTLSFINLHLFGYTLLKEAENQQTESGVVQKAQRKVKKKKKE